MRSANASTVLTVTAEPLPSAGRGGRPSYGLLRAFAGDAATEALALAAAIPFLFLHATYQPTLSIGVGTTSIDATLADAAIALVRRGGRRAGAAARDGRRSARPGLLLGLTAAFVVVGAVSLATPSLLGEDYALGVHAISLAKFAWYACLLPATVLLVRGTRDAVPLLRAVVAWSVAATSWGLLQFLGVVSEFEGKRPGPAGAVVHRDPRLRRALGRSARRRRAGDRSAGWPAGGRRWAVVGVVTGALGVILSGAMTAVLGMWLAVAAVLLGARVLRALNARRALALLAVALVVSAGTATMRASTIERFAEFIGLREKVADTGVESYAHRTLLAYIGGRIWLDRPVTGVGWQASSEEWAYGPFLADARARFPDEPDQAFPSPGHPVGDPDALPPGRRRPRGRGDPRPRRPGRDGDRHRDPRDPFVAGGALRPRLAARRDRCVERDRPRLRASSRCADVAFIRAGDRP